MSVPQTKMDSSHLLVEVIQRPISGNLIIAILVHCPSSRTFFQYDGFRLRGLLRPKKGCKKEMNPEAIQCITCGTNLWRTIKGEE